MWITIKKITILIAALWITGCAQTSVRHHQDFEVVAKTIDSVVIIPADVEIELINFDGDNELLEDKSALIKEKIQILATDKLLAENLNVIEFDFAIESEKDEEFAYALTQAKEAWNKAKEEMYERGMIPEKQKAEFQTNLGSVLNAIADKTNADAVVLMHYTGFEKSSGMIAKDVASSVLVGVLTLGAVVPIQASEGSFIDVAMVETNSGKVIWANRKYGASVDHSPAEVAFEELPDLVWKTELLTDTEVTETNAIDNTMHTTSEDVSSPKAN